MIVMIKCPSCGSEISASGEVADYDWESGVSENGLAEDSCICCGSTLRLEAHATVDYVEAFDD